MLKADRYRWTVVADLGDVLSLRTAQPRRMSCHGMCCGRIASDRSCYCCSYCLHASIRRRRRRRRARKHCCRVRITAIVRSAPTVQITNASGTSARSRRATAPRVTALQVRRAIWGARPEAGSVRRRAIAIVTASTAACAGLDGARATSGRSRRATAPGVIARPRGRAASTASAAAEAAAGVATRDAVAARGHGPRGSGGAASASSSASRRSSAAPRASRSRCSSAKSGGRRNDQLAGSTRPGTLNRSS